MEKRGDQGKREGGEQLFSDVASGARSNREKSIIGDVEIKKEKSS